MSSADSPLNKMIEGMYKEIASLPVSEIVDRRMLNYSRSKELKKIIPEIYWDEFNQLFVKFGQTICVPISPFCSKCPIKKFCKQVNIQKKR